ncbi:MAG: hypothetical protein WCC27_12720, partial [Acidobacteriaceae bacterium]
MRKVGLSRILSASLSISALIATAPRAASAQSPDDIVRKVVKNELDADFNDHTAWMYRDAYKSPDKDIVKIVIETQQGNLSEIIEDGGRAPSAQEHQDDLSRIEQMLTDPALRARMKRNEQHDGEQARDMMNMLPNAFIWQITGHDNGNVTLSFRPKPDYTPGSMNGRVLATMAGTMVVDEEHMRLRDLNGHLVHDVLFGWGILGHINAGGAFHIVRDDVGFGSWQITAMHVHISGHALFFKTIGDQEDEITSDYH